MTHIRFPLPTGPIVLPTRSRTACLAGIASWSACRPVPRAVRAGSWWFVKALGPLLLPFPRREWVPPFAAGEWRELVARWAALLGPIEAFAVYEPAQAGRLALALLAVGSTGAIGFIKVRPASQTSVEGTALSAASAAGTVLCPQVIGAAKLGEVSYLVTTAFPSGLHRPPKPERVAVVVEDVSRSLGAIPRPTSVPHDWEPMHGDFAPWNLREQRGMGLILFDFEHAGWAPPLADLVFYAAACSALGMTVPSLDGRALSSAVEYWSTRLPMRMGESGRDQRLFRGMMSYLGSLSLGEPDF